MTQLLTPTGYKDLATVNVGDQVVAFDPVTGAKVTNTIERVEYITKKAHQECNAPQGYNDGEAPPTLKPGDVPFKFYRINDQWTLFQDQSIWYLRVPGAEANVCHVSDLQVGDTLFDENDNSVVITSIVEQDGNSWYRFAISGDHSYIVDGLTLHNASRFWVGSGLTTNWNATGNTNWASSTGGSNNASVPGTSDAVFFDGNSGSGNSVLSAAITVQNCDFDGYTGTFTHNAFTLTCNTAGTFRFGSGMTYTPASLSSIVTFTHTVGTVNLTCNGKSFFALTINGAGGTTTLIDTLVCNAGLNAIVTLTAGTLDAFTNLAPITAIEVSSSNSNTRAFSAGGLIKIGGNAGFNQTIWNFATTTNLTWTKNSANIEVLQNVPSTTGVLNFVGGGLTYNGLTLDANAWRSTFIFAGSASNTFASFSWGGNWNVQITGTATTTINSGFSSPGTQSNPEYLRSSSTNSANLSVPSGTVSLNWSGLESIIAAGGANFVATNTLDFGNNTGFLITPPANGTLAAPGMASFTQRAIKAGTASQTIDVPIPSGIVAGGLTGLLYNSSGLTAYYRKGATGASTSFALATQTVGGAYTSGGFVEIDATNMPGMYRLDVPDTILASTPNATIYLQGAASMVPVIVELEIVGYDPTDATALGLSRLDATVSSRMATFSYTAPDNADIAAIKAKTDNLPAAPADESLIIAAANSLATSIAALPTTTTVNAIKAKTDNLPASPAATGDAMTLTSAYDAAKTAAQASDIPSADISDIKTVADGLPTFVHTAGKLWVLDGNGNAVAPASQTQAIQDKTDNLPDDPADESLVIAATNSLASAIAALPSASQNATALLTSADAVDSLTPQEAFKIMLAALAGKVSGLSGTTATFRDTDDTVDRIVATVDANGDRSAVTLNGT